MTRCLEFVANVARRNNGIWSEQDWCAKSTLNTHQRFFFALTAYFQDLTLQKKWGFQLSSETDVLRFGRCSHLPTMVKTRKFWRPFLEYLMIEPFSSYHRVICPIGDDVPTVSGSPFIGCMTGKSQGRMTIALPCADHGDSTLNLVLCRFCSGSLLGSEQHRGCVPTISPRS